MSWRARRRRPCSASEHSALDNAFLDDHARNSVVTPAASCTMLAAGRGSAAPRRPHHAAPGDPRALSARGLNAGHACGSFERAPPRGRFFDPQVEGTNEGRVNFFLGANPVAANARAAQVGVQRGCAWAHAARGLCTPARTCPVRPVRQPDACSLSEGDQHARPLLRLHQGGRASRRYAVRVDPRRGRLRSGRTIVA
jgi:hypothetical protein